MARCGAMIASPSAALPEAFLTIRWERPDTAVDLRTTGQNPFTQIGIRCAVVSYDKPNEFVQRFCPVVLRVTLPG